MTFIPQSLQNNAKYNPLINEANVRTSTPKHQNWNCTLTFCNFSIKTAFTPVLSKLRFSNSARKSTTRRSFNLRPSSLAILVTQYTLRSMGSRITAIQIVVALSFEE